MASNLKQMMREKVLSDPDRFFATTVLRKEGFQRFHCKTCSRYFWATHARATCDDPECSGGFRFIGHTPAKKKLDYIQTWLEFSRFFQSRGYTPIKRYPVVARWRDDTDWVQASIYDFQPYVVSGEVRPPANPLVVPQFCLRFNDIDNVGITGAHCTGFVMIGQHAFVPQSEWKQEKYFSDLLDWFLLVLGIPKDELVLHEDGWIGGGNAGPCMEFFCRGLELCNQVYMLYEVLPSGELKDLKLRVLDMGLGHERNAWFSTGSGTSYDATFPTVIEKLQKLTGVTIDRELQRKFLPYAAYLNVDETTNLDKAWAKVASMIGMDAKELRHKIEPVAALYSIAEHTRSLLVAISDGAIPSNVGGMYNLRVLLRRSLGFIDTFGWKIDLGDVCAWHAEYLLPLFPELSTNLANTRKILKVEEQRYHETKLKSNAQVTKVALSDPTVAQMVELYDTQGISPAQIAAEAARHGKTIKIPDNFYALVAARHQQPDQETQTQRAEKLPLDGVPETEPLYFKDYTILTSQGRVLKVLGKHVVLDKTCFYPVSGGQLHDTGAMNGIPVVDVFKQGSVIVHTLDREATFMVGDIVTCTVDKDRRLQLAQHHSATHIVGAAARKVLGNHINQASAKKDMDKAYIDLTHYELISKEDLQRIEQEANAIVDKHVSMRHGLHPRDVAEKTFGTAIYQGGAVPGKSIRVVEIPGIDAQACGGTHLNNTAEAGHISILKVAKVKDGVVRIYFVAGKADATQRGAKDALINEWATLLQVKPDQIPARAEELFLVWKKARKMHSKGTVASPEDVRLSSTATFSGDIVAKTSEVLGTQPEHVSKTIKRFIEELLQYQRP